MESVFFSEISFRCFSLCLRFCTLSFLGEFFSEILGGKVGNLALKSVQIGIGVITCVLYELLGGSNMQQIYGNFENEKTCSRKSPTSSGVPQRRVSSEVCWPSFQCSWKLSQVGLLWQNVANCNQNMQPLAWNTNFWQRYSPYPRRLKFLQDTFEDVLAIEKAMKIPRFLLLKPNWDGSYLARPLSRGKSSRPAPEDAVFGGTVRAWIHRLFRAL